MDPDNEIVNTDLPLSPPPTEPSPSGRFQAAMRAIDLWRSVVVAGLGALNLQASAALGDQTAVTTPQVRAELLAYAPDGLAPGQEAWLGLRITHRPEWHTYWKNPGDSGLATSLQWTLPAGLESGDIQWPTPHKLPVGPLMNYGYEGTLLLPVPLHVGQGFDATQAEIRLRADWLVCKEVCIPESGEFRLTLPGRASSGTEHAAVFQAAKQAVPTPLEAARTVARFDGYALSLEVEGLPASWQGRGVEVFSEQEGVVDHAAPTTAQWDGAVWRSRVALSPQRFASPSRLTMVLVGEGDSPGRALNFDIAGAWPEPPPAGNASIHGATAAPSGGAAAPAAGTTPPIGLWAALLLALGGGALLNLMPCVFPVLSLKVLGFAAHAHDARQRWGGALAYAAGVVLSFVALAGLMLALRAGGEQLGWGFQLQSPPFVAALALLFTLIALNLAGVFHVGSVLPSGLATARARHPMVDSLLTGVLAVAVASPCTAPFMGASLGLAVTLPTAQALTVFAALGVGMALPYVLASASPWIARRLPRPGAWMETFKVAMAFPMFATVLWLTWVLGQQAGLDAATALLAVLLALAFAAWALASPTLGRWSRVGLGAASIAVLALTSVWAWPMFTPMSVAATSTPASARWLAWDPARVEAARAEGRPVFVDFTAAWCVTCQFNKRGTLATDEVLAEFDARRVLLMRADWTRRDAQIGAELQRLGRSGVPVYALYAPGTSPATPQLLPEILSRDAVREALANLPGS